MIEVQVPETATCKMLKKAIEDKEGIAIEGMSIRTTSNRVTHTYGHTNT